MAEVQDNYPKKELLIKRSSFYDDLLFYISKNENVFNSIIDFSLACLFLLKFSEFEIYIKRTGISDHNKKAGAPGIGESCEP